MSSRLHDLEAQSTALFIVIAGRISNVIYVAFDSNLHTSYEPQVTSAETSTPKS
jgi:hypothetical protein